MRGQVRDEWKRASVLPDETIIATEDLRGQTQCMYQDRGVVVT